MKNALSLICQQGDLSIEGDFLDSIHRKTKREGEEALILAVLEDAIHCFQKYLMARNRRGENLFREAEDWILATDVDSPFSFENICETLGLDPSYLREGLMGWKEKKLTESWQSKVYPLLARQARTKGNEREARLDDEDVAFNRRRHG